MIAIDAACEFETISRREGLQYQRCRRCGQVLPSFDSAERTYYSPCPAAANVAARRRPGVWRVWREAIERRVPKLLRTFLVACWRWGRAGFPRSAAQVRARRRDACRLCPLQQQVGPGRVVERCGSCGCWLPAKRWFATEQCPAERWPGQKHADGQGLTLVDGKLTARRGCGCGG